MTDPVSFTNEHSSEYILVADLVRRLSGDFDRIVVDFVWLSRINGRIAKQSLVGRRFRLATAFARRPKVRSAGDCQVMMRVNDELFDAAHALEARGCPVFAGVPLVSHMLGFTIGAECAWFRLHDFGRITHGMTDVWISLDGFIEGDPNLSGPLSSGDIVSAVEGAKLLDADELVDVIREMRHALSHGRGRRWGGAYKPFHLLIAEHHHDND